MLTEEYEDGRDEHALSGHHEEYACQSLSQPHGLYGGWQEQKTEAGLCTFFHSVEHVEDEYLAESRGKPEHGSGRLRGKAVASIQRKAEQENQQKSKKQSLYETGTACERELQVLGADSESAFQHAAPPGLMARARSLSVNTKSACRASSSTS